MTAARIVLGLLLMCFVTLTRTKSDDAELRALLKERVDTQRWATVSL